MPADVWVEIQEDEAVLSAVKYEVSLVVFGIACNRAKHAALGF
jgi:hypothetical protein